MYGSSGPTSQVLADGTHSYSYDDTMTRVLQLTGVDSAAYTHDPTGLVSITDETNGYALRLYNAPNGRGLGYRVGGSRAWYVTDRQGSVVAVTDERGVKLAGYAYDPYGNTRASEEVDVQAVLNPRRYTGARYDLTTGLYLLGVRWYDPTQGRFTQPDPASRETNPYLYAAANPTNKADPTGQYDCDTATECENIFVNNYGPMGAAIGAVAGIFWGPVGIGVGAALGGGAGVLYGVAKGDAECAKDLGCDIDE